MVNEQYTNPSADIRAYMKSQYSQYNSTIISKSFVITYHIFKHIAIDLLRLKSLSEQNISPPSPGLSRLSYPSSNRSRMRVKRVMLFLKASVEASAVTDLNSTSKQFSIWQRAASN